ncbi:hypothetical protein BG004_002735 [Podila humilis]|nr:hypothetical protein BG004_002735 [Podila humilis]
MTTPDLPRSLTVPIPVDADSSFFSNLYHETSGPRKDIYITHEQASRLIAFHLQKQLSQLFYFKRGYNNRVYLAQVNDDDDEDRRSEYIIRLGGRFWDHAKITNEVKAVQLARKALEDIVAVPTFVGTSLDEAKIHPNKADRIVPFDYVIMERLPGVPLDTVWDDLLLVQKKKIADQVAQIFVALRSIQLDAIGNFVQGSGNRSQIGPLMEGGQGPFASWGEFVAKNIRQEIEYMSRSHGDNFDDLKQFLPRLHRLVAKVLSGELERQFENHLTSTISGAGALPTTTAIAPVEERPISFLHGDMESRNMLVIGSKIVGLHDFEFAGGFPSEHEWCAGFEWLFARAEDPFDEVEQRKLKEMTKDERELQEYFLGVLKNEYGILQFGENYQLYKVVLYHLQVNIAPWWLRDISKTEWTEGNHASLKVAMDSLDKSLKFLRC